MFTSYQLRKGKVGPKTHVFKGAGLIGIGYWMCIAVITGAWCAFVGLQMGNMW